MKQKQRNYNDLLIWAAALVTVVRYAAAFIASDMPMITGVLSLVITIALGLSGLGMGVLDVIGGAVLFQGWRKVMPRNGQGWPMRFKVLTGFVLGLIVNGIVIIVPFTVSRVLQSTMEHVLGDGLMLWCWAIAVNVAPYMLIGGVSTSANIINTGGEQNEQTEQNHIPKSEQTEQIEQSEQLNIVTLGLVCEYLSQSPGASARDLLRIPGIPFTSPATASKYKKAAEEMLK